MSSQKKHNSKKVKERQKQKRIEKQQQKITRKEPQKQPQSEIKKHPAFSTFLFSYIIVILIAGALLLMFLWNKLSTFQVNYERAKSEANPDLVIGDYLDLFNCGNISKLVVDEWDALSPYETEENIKAFISSNVDDEKISWERRSDFSDLKPKYDIFSDDNYIGAVELKQKSEVDGYGFHMCELGRAEVGFTPLNLKSITINAYDGVSVYINGSLLTDEYASQSILSNDMDKEASEETGVTYKINRYELSGFLEYPEVSIDKEGYICDMDVAEGENGKREYSQLTMYDPLILSEVSDRVLEIAKAYDMYAVGRREIGGMGSYFIYSGKGYRMLSGLAFDISIAGTTTVYDILSEDVGNLLVYSQEDIVIDTHQSIHRVHRNIEYDEDINIRWYLKKVSGRWMVKDFSMRL